MIITGRVLHMSLSQEDDPLDAFMAELRDVEKQSEAPAPDKKRKADVALDEEADNVADFMEVCQLHAAILSTTSCPRPGVL